MTWALTKGKTPVHTGVQLIRYVSVSNPSSFRHCWLDGYIELLGANRTEVLRCGFAWTTGNTIIITMCSEGIYNYLCFYPLSILQKCHWQEYGRPTVPVSAFLHFGLKKGRTWQPVVLVLLAQWYGWWVSMPWWTEISSVAIHLASSLRILNQTILHSLSSHMELIFCWTGSTTRPSPSVARLWWMRSMSGGLKAPLSLSMEDVSSRQWQYRRVSGRHLVEYILPPLHFMINHCV